MSGEAAASPALAAQMQALRAGGASYNAIAAVLNQSGVRGRQGGRWFPASVRRALQQAETAAPQQAMNHAMNHIKESQCKV